MSICTLWAAPSLYICVNTLYSLRSHSHWKTNICTRNKIHNSLPFRGRISTVEGITEFYDFSILLLQLPLVFHVVLDQLWESCKLLSSIQIIEVTSVLNFDVSDFAIASETIEKNRKINVAELNNVIKLSRPTAGHRHQHTLLVLNCTQVSFPQCTRCWFLSNLMQTHWCSGFGGWHSRIAG